MNPFELVQSLQNEENFAFLYSGMAPGTKSIIAWGAEKKYNELPKQIDSKLYGYFGYELRHQLENYPHDKPSYILLPALQLMQFKNETVIPAQAGIQPLRNIDNWISASAGMTSNMTDAEYLKKAATVIGKIHEGELYQANLTRKFYGEFESDPDPFAIFCKLASISPAPYSAYLKFGDTHIISASPEKFLTIENGIATTSPIKGTLSAESPAALLATSEKDRAENLMIVDLMRNDLAKTCNNVRVEKLFEVTSYTKYHHMSSTISGDVAAPVLDVVMGCFPPGSMTGAPKIHAIKLCSELEQMERGVYSGALGWISPDACDLSVVIRTLVIKGKKFEFQVGGGIVADSTPEKELEEIYVKAKPIFETLGIKRLPLLQ